MCYVWGCIVATAMVVGLYINPVCMTKYANTFGIKPVTYYGCNFTEAAGVSLFFAIFCTLCTILVLIVSVSFKGKLLSGMFGVCAFLGMLSTTVSAYYQKRSIDILGHMSRTTLSQKFSFGEGEWSYSEEDWGVFFDMCSNYSIDNYKFGKCLNDEFVSKALKYIDFQWKYRSTGIVVSCCLVLFLISPKPLTTVFVALLLALITSIWALPIYATAVYVRSPDKYVVREYCNDKAAFLYIIGFGWSMALCLIPFCLFAACGHKGIPGVIVVVLLLVTGCFGVVVPIMRLGEDCKLNAAYYHENLKRTSIPHFTIAGLIALCLVVTIISCLCGQPEAPTYVVRVIIL